MMGQFTEVRAIYMICNLGEKNKDAYIHPKSVGNIIITENNVKYRDSFHEVGKSHKEVNGRVIALQNILYTLQFVYVNTRNTEVIIKSKVNTRFTSHIVVHVYSWKGHS